MVITLVPKFHLHPPDPLGPLHLGLYQSWTHLLLLLHCMRLCRECFFNLVCSKSLPKSNAFPKLNSHGCAIEYPLLLQSSYARLLLFARSE
ncbi:hypothetical protein Plhal304r1_c009g0036441 [Plasmopara halstedii]